jgi:hypothetical protein
MESSRLARILFAAPEKLTSDVSLMRKDRRMTRSFSYPSLPSVDVSRRKLLAAAAAVVLTPGCAAGQQGASMQFDPFPPLPTTPTPGRPGDFDFLTGEWRIHHRSIVNGAWLEYEGEATVHAILAGICSVEELRIPARNFSGMGLRLLDVERRIWSDHWVNARSGVLTTPGQIGSFENGAGIS